MKKYLIQAIAFKGEFYAEGQEHDLPDEIIEALGDNISEYAIAIEEVGLSVPPVENSYKRGRPREGKKENV